MNLLCEAARQCARVTVALTMDQPSARDARIFMTQRLTAQELAQRLQDEGLLCAWNWHHPGAQDRPVTDPAIAHLEKHLFARDGHPLPCDPEAVRIHTAADPYDEAATCAAVLTAWHREGIPWERMAVAVASQDENLLGVLDATLEAMRVPHCLSRKDAALRHGLVRLLLCAVRAACGGWRQSDLLGVIKSGFAPLESAECQALENYALEYGIDRARWNKPFTRGDRPEAAEPLRLKLMGPLTRLHDRLKQARDAAASVEALYLLLSETDAYARLRQREEELLRAGLSAQASQNRQVWRLLMALMDQMFTLLGGQRAVMGELPQLLEAGLRSLSIAALPPLPHVVMAGQAGHVMTGRIEALAVLGLQDGVASAGAESLISDKERQRLSQGARRSVGLGRAEQFALRQSDFYRTLTLPSRRLYLSCSAADQQGSALRPATLLSDVSRLLPDAPVTGGAQRQRETRLLSPQTALEELAPQLRACLENGTEPDAETREVMLQLLNDPVWSAPAHRVLEALRAENRAGPLPRSKAERLYRSDHVSVSRLEDFAQCPHRGFVARGLRLKPRKDWAWEADEQGTFFHAVLERYTTLAAERAGWPDLSDEEESALFEEAVRSFREDLADTPLNDDAMSRRQGEEIVRTVHAAARMFTRHARRSGFSSSRAEVHFGRGGSLPPIILRLSDGSHVALEGTIDRIDLWDTGDARFVGVVDHKSSNLSLEKERIWYGLQLQLLVYLKAAEQSAGDALPAGAFYFQIQDPLVKAGDEVVEATEHELAKLMQLKGVVLSDTRVLDLMSKGGCALIDDPRIKGGGLSKSKLACDLEEMHHLMDYAVHKAAELAEEMRSGRIDLAPAAIGTSFDACDHCILRGHCPLDEALPGTGHRHLDGEGKDQYWAAMLSGEAGKN